MLHIANHNPDFSRHAVYRMLLPSLLCLAMVCPGGFSGEFYAQDQQGEEQLFADPFPEEDLSESMAGDYAEEIFEFIDEEADIESDDLISEEEIGEEAWDGADWQSGFSVEDLSEAGMILESDPAAEAADWDLPEESLTETGLPLGEDEQPTSGSCGSNVSWRVEERYGASGEYVLYVTGNDYDTVKMDDYVIPAQRPWQAFSEKISSVSVRFENYSYSQKKTFRIGSSAFYGMDSVRDVYITASSYQNAGECIIDIGDRSFANCRALQKVTFSGSLGKIEYGAFAGCENLKTIQFDQSVEEIGELAFAGCESLETVIFPVKTGIVADGAFDYCTSLQSVRFAGNGPDQYGDIFGGVSGFTVTIQQQYQDWLETYMSLYPDSLVTPQYISNTVGENCTWTLQEDGTLLVTGSGPLREDTWPWLENEAVFNAVKKISIGEGITVLGAGAFDYPGFQAYRKMTVSAVTLPSTLTSIEDRALAGVSITTQMLRIPAGVKYIGTGALPYFWHNINIASINWTDYEDKYSYVSISGNVEFMGPMPELAENTFIGSMTLIVPVTEDSWNVRERQDGENFHGGTVSWLFAGEGMGGEGVDCYLDPSGSMYITGRGTFRNNMPDSVREKVKTLYIQGAYVRMNDPVSFCLDFPNLESVYGINNSYTENGHLFSGTSAWDSTLQKDVFFPSLIFFYSPLCEDEAFILPETIRTLDIRLLRNRYLQKLYVNRDTQLTGLSQGENGSSDYPFTVYVYAGSEAYQFCSAHNLKYELVNGRWSDMAYSIQNHASAFGYDSGFRIPETAYQRIWGRRYIAHYIRDQIRGWSGNCFGMSSAALFSNMEAQNMGPGIFGKESISQIAAGDVNSYYGLTQLDIFETLQVSQYTKRIQNAYWNNKNRISQIAALAENADVNGYGVLIALFEGTSRGHILVGYDVQHVSQTTDHLMVYDCNFPNNGTPGNSERYIELTKNTAGEYTGWYYHHNNKENWGNSCGNYWMTYVPYEDLVYVWSRRGVLRSEGNYIATRASDAVIRDEAGNDLAIIRDGALYANDASIREVISADDGQSAGEGAVFLQVPATGKYIIEKRGGAGGELAVSFANTEKGVAVATSAGQILFNGNDEQNICTATILSSADDSYTITTSENSGSGEVVHTITGLTGGQNVDSAQNAGGSDRENRDGKTGDSAAGEDPFIRVNAARVKLKKGQRTDGLLVSMADGDRVESVKSSSNRIVAVSVRDAKKGVIRLKGKKVGKARVTITLASGLKTTVKVAVQKKPVQTSGIRLLSPSQMTLKRGQKAYIAAEVRPFTSRDRISYSVDKKQVVSVSKKGTVTGKKAGQAKITLRAGRKKKVITVRVQ